MTHKVSGPAYVISVYIKELLKGNYPQVRQLRKGDELMGLHEQIVELIEYLKNKEKNKI
jgi:hypothetical protein